MARNKVATIRLLKESQVMLAFMASETSYGPNAFINGQSASNGTNRSFLGFKYASSSGNIPGVMFLLSTDTTGLKVVEVPKFLLIHTLETKRLLAPLSVLVEKDGQGFLAQTIDLPLYGSGDSMYEAIEMLKSEVESLHKDLMEDDNFSDEWLTKRKLLAAIVAD